MIVAVLRPDPARTVARVAALGYEALALPLFVVSPVASRMPDGPYDAMLLTSANAVRHGGAVIAGGRHLPVLAVGAATAAAARDAGLDVVLTGTTDAAALLASASGYARILHPGGRDRTLVADDRVTPVVVYRSDPTIVAAGALDAVVDGVVLLHSQRAARRFASLAARDGIDRARISLAAISPTVAAAAGEGWRQVSAAPQPSEGQLLALLPALAR